MKTIICGNSHVGALRRGFRDLFPRGGPDLTIFPLGNGSYERAPFSVLHDGAVQFTIPKFIENLTQYTGRQAIDDTAIRWGFCLGTQNARVYSSNFWIDAEPAAICSAGKQPVSDAVIGAIVAADQQHVRAFFAQTGETGMAPFVVSGAPPSANHACLARGVRPETVLYLDNVARRALTNHLSDLGFDFIAPPAETIGQDGFLKPEYCHVRKNGRTDGHHANNAYGALMLKKVLDYLGIAN